MRARDVPVFTMGVGDTARPLDAELVRDEYAAARAGRLRRSNIEAFVSLSGYGATKVLMSVREDGRAIKTEEFNLRGNDTQADQSRDNSVEGGHASLHRRDHSA